MWVVSRLFGTCVDGLDGCTQLIATWRSWRHMALAGVEILSLFWFLVIIMGLMLLLAEEQH